MEHDLRQTVQSSKQLLSDLERRHAEAEGAVSAIVERRKPLALAAEMGDETSRKGLARLADEERAAELRLRDLGFAVDAARTQLDQAKARAHSADMEQLDAVYAAHAAVALDAAREMDEAARALVAGRAKLVAAHAGMAATQIVNGATLNRLLFRASLTRCLVKHGFAEFAEIQRIASPTLLPTFEQLVEGVVGAARSTNLEAA